MDRCSILVLTHIELESSVVIVLLVHGELIFEGLPFGSKSDRCIREITDPACIRRGYAYDALSVLISADVECQLILVALSHRKIRMNELYGILFCTAVGGVDDHLTILDLCGSFAAVKQQELPVDIVFKVLGFGELTVTDEVTVRERASRKGFSGFFTFVS